MNIDQILYLTQGFVLCASLIIAIGPQNLFVIQQGLRGNYLLTTALVCVLGDILLITLGVGGVGSALSANMQQMQFVTICGVAFLLFYAGKSFQSAWHCCQSDKSRASAYVPMTMQATVLTALGFSLLNPLAYLDSVVVIGMRSSQFALDQRLFFALGAILASTFWFFALTYGARRLSPLLGHPAAWRRLDVVSGGLMLGIAVVMGASMCVI